MLIGFLPQEIPYSAPQPANQVHATVKDVQIIQDWNQTEAGKERTNKYIQRLS